MNCVKKHVDISDTCCNLLSEFMMFMSPFKGPQGRLVPFDLPGAAAFRRSRRAKPLGGGGSGKLEICLEEGGIISIFQKQTTTIKLKHILDYFRIPWRNTMGL